MSFVKAICGSLIHKNLTLSEGGIAQIEKSDIDYVIKEWERQGLLIIRETYEEVANFKYKGLAALAEESLPSLNPEVIYDKKGNETGTVPVKTPTFDFEKHAPVSPEDNFVVEATPVKEEKKPEIKTQGKDDKKPETKPEDSK